LKKTITKSKNDGKKEQDLIPLLKLMHRNIISARMDRLKKKRKPD
jgi:hypothetical protein